MQNKKLKKFKPGLASIYYLRI